MKFGSVTSLKGIDLSLPKDHPQTVKVLGGEPAAKMNIYVGCAKWNRSDLKNFYPKGTSDELTYYAQQFNSIELNATFYQPYGKEQYKLWAAKAPKDFRFCPKLNQTISHRKRLKDVKNVVEDFCASASALQEKLGMLFLQLHDNFKPKDYDRLEQFIREFPKGFPLAVELRNTEWCSDKKEAERVTALFRKYDISNIIVDTAGRRDLLHMNLTSRTAFIRYVGANHPSDYDRLQPWVDRIAAWKKAGLKEVYFFIHQNHELESPLISARFIELLNKKLGTSLHVPATVVPAKSRDKASGKKSGVKKKALKKPSKVVKKKSAAKKASPKKRA